MVSTNTTMQIYNEEIPQLSWFQILGFKVCTICVPVNNSNSALKEMILGTQTPFPAVSCKREGLVHPDIFAFTFKELNVDLDIHIQGLQTLKLQSLQLL